MEILWHRQQQPRVDWYRKRDRRPATSLAVSGQTYQYKRSTGKLVAGERQLWCQPAPIQHSAQHPNEWSDQNNFKWMVRYFLGSLRTAAIRFRVSTNIWSALLYSEGSTRNLPAVPSPLSRRSA